MDTVRLDLAMAASNNWCLYHMDVFNSFLQGDLVEEVYIVPPPRFVSWGEMVASKLADYTNPFIYQAGSSRQSRQWNLKLVEALTSSRFNQSRFDYSLFTRKVGDNIVIILVYVDDLLITDNDYNVIHEAKVSLQERFRIKDLGEIKYFLGIEIARSLKGTLINQRKFALDLVTNLGWQELDQ